MGIKKCNQLGCSYNTDDKCLEGNGEECSHIFTDETLVNEVTLVETQSVKLPNTNVKLYSGEELSFKDVYLVTHKYPFKLILIIGDYESGKTTLLATLFDLFQIGPLREYLFAGSLTQIGFEKRCHLSRVLSKLNSPDTDRTKSKEFSFLHLATQKKETLNKKAINLLISDVSGERFKKARDSAPEMKEIEFIRDSDHIIIMIDGKKISNPKDRNREIMNSERFIQMALDVGVFNKQTDLKIVLSKWDLLYKDDSFDFLNIIETPFLEKFSQRVNSIVFVKIASRPVIQDDTLKLGHGLYELLNEWSEPREIKIKVLITPKSNRSFNNYKLIDN